jgi:hypothetical protein
MGANRQIRSLPQPSDILEFGRYATGKTIGMTGHVWQMV